MLHTKKALTTTLHHEISYLLKHNQHPPIHPDIDAVWVFSGPGTVYSPLDTDNKPWMAWMDKYRVLYGITIVREVTAKRLGKRVKEVTKEDIRQHGPLFIYNGIPEENHDLRLFVLSEESILPSEKVLIVDTVVKDGEERKIENTLDQVMSLPKDIFDDSTVETQNFASLPIKRRLAIVSHVAHVVRILRYLEKYQTIPEGVIVEVFSLKPNEQGMEEYTRTEIEKVWEYYKKGDLSWEPIRVEGT